MNRGFKCLDYWNLIGNETKRFRIWKLKIKFRREIWMKLRKLWMKIRDFKRGKTFAERRNDWERENLKSIGWKRKNGKRIFRDKIKRILRIIRKINFKSYTRDIKNEQLKWKIRRKDRNTETIFRWLISY